MARHTSSSLSNGLRLAGVSLALSSALCAQLGTPRQIAKKPLIPQAILHEVLFDPVGVDGSAGNTEWVELYTSRSVNLSGWSLRDHTGKLLHTFGDLPMPKYGTVLVLFTATVPFPHDSDPSDGQVAVAVGLPAGDHLGNDAGGVRLHSPSGQLQDALYWGTGASPAGAPRGQWFDLSFASGTPMGEGDSLGRPANPYGTYTGQVGDWQRHGGKNALRATPGGRNGVDVYNLSGMLAMTQATIVDVLTGFSDQAEPGRLEFQNASVSSTAIATSQSSISIIAVHTFDITDNGVAGTLSGSVSTSYSFDESPGSVSYGLSLSGSLNSTTGFDIDIDYSLQSAGAHTNVTSRHTETDATFYESGQSYPWSIVADTTSARVGQDSWRDEETRTIVDYGGAGTKTSSSVTTHTRLADGVYRIVFDLTRSHPIAMPALWDAGTQTLSGIEQSGITHTRTVLSSGEHSGTVSRFDLSIDGGLIRTLDAARAATYSSTIDAAGTSGTTVARDYSLTLPVLFYGSPVALGMQASGVDSIVAGKSISTATRSVTLNGYEILGGEAFVDPPLALLASALPPAPPRQELPSPAPASDDAPKQDDGPKDAVATCAPTGAVIGAIVGGAAGAAAAVPPRPIGIVCCPPPAIGLLGKDGLCYLYGLSGF